MILYYMGYYFHPSYLLVIIGSIILLLAQAKVKSAYSKYSQIRNSMNMSGQEIAAYILNKFDLNVRIEKISGNLSDHYDPSTKTLRLSEGIYDGRSIAAISVAAHECGHALQDQENYYMLRLRSGLLPFANGGSSLGWIAVMIGLFMGNTNVALIGLAMLSLMLLFQVVTLPVEFDASHRALRIMAENNLIFGDEQNMCNEMLSAAALTYIAAVASTLLNLLRILWIILGSRRND